MFAEGMMWIILMAIPWLLLLSLGAIICEPLEEWYEKRAQRKRLEELERKMERQHVHRLRRSRTNLEGHAR